MKSKINTGKLGLILRNMRPLLTKYDVFVLIMHGSVRTTLDFPEDLRGLEVPAELIRENDA